MTVELAHKEVALTIKSADNKHYLVDGNKLVLQSAFRTLFHSGFRRIGLNGGRRTGVGIIFGAQHH